MDRYALLRVRITPEVRRVAEQLQSRHGYIAGHDALAGLLAIGLAQAMAEEAGVGQAACARFCEGIQSSEVVQ